MFYVIAPLYVGCMCVCAGGMTGWGGRRAGVMRVGIYMFIHVHDLCMFLRMYFMYLMYFYERSEMTLLIKN